MENLKIRVNNEEESKEAQELFFELGAKRRNILENWKNNDYQSAWFALGKSGELFNEVIFIDNDSGISCSSMYKEITLPELRDMVVLKQNDVGDATHKGSITDNVYYVSSDEEVYRFESSAWCFSTVIVADLKPIEKPMKEYLTKMQDSSYKLIPLKMGDDDIEIPEGADIYAISKNCKENIFFAKSSGDTLETFNTINKNDWHQESTLTLENLENNYSILWQRHTKPEELPFVDDEPSINDQYAEIEQVRKEYKLKNNMSVDDYINSLRCEDTVNHPSHYASGEIECIDAIESSMTHEAFCGYLKGNIQKYMWRYENKGGLESLEKAQWYLNKLISRIG